jgi:oxygen-dependent protoporphyrinogen oxidase
MGEPFDTVVVGAGISGLTTAFRLRRAGQRVAVVEAAERVGGAIETLRDGGWTVELGPNTVAGGEEFAALVRDVGLDGEQLLASAAAKRRFLWKGGRLQALPGGPGEVLGTPLLSPAAKLRLLREPFVGRFAGDGEESVAAFVRRRLGDEMLRTFVGPFVSGVYAGDPERLSVRWAVPRIAALEREHGSLIGGALARRRGFGAAAAGPAARGLVTFRDGLSTLPRRLAEAVGDVRTGWRCRRVVADGDGGLLVEGGAETLRARRLVLAVPADAAAELLADASAGRSRGLADLPYAAVAIFAAGFRREEVLHPLDGFGFLVPRGESLRLLGCLFPSTLFPGRAPSGHVLVTAFLGGRGDPGAVELDDAALRALVLDELRRALGVRGAPAFEVVRRWPRAIPQYELGHGRFLALAAALEREPAFGGALFLGGSILRGVSVSDCVRDGSALAERVLAAA